MPNKYFSCQTDKAPYAYRCGEPVRFHIRYRENGKTIPAAGFRWKIAGDFGLAREGVEGGSTGELTLEASLDRPGFLYVTVTALDENGAPAPESDGFFGGAGVEIEKIQAVTEEPADYHAFWDACKTELFAVAPDVIETLALPEDPEHPNHKIYDVKLACAGGKPVSGILTAWSIRDTGSKAHGSISPRRKMSSASMRTASTTGSRRNIMIRLPKADLPAMALTEKKTGIRIPAISNI